MSKRVKAPRKHDPEFRKQAGRLVIDEGMSVRPAADDLGIASTSLDTWVRKFRYGTWSLDDCTEALTQFANISFHYVLTDIHLGGQINYQGFEDIKILRYLRENIPEVIPLAMTSDPKIKTYQDVLKEGVEYLFRKPIISKDELLIHVNAARSRRLVGSLVKRRASRADPQ